MSAFQVLVGAVLLCNCFAQAQFFIDPPSYGDLVLQRYSFHLYISVAPDGIEHPVYMLPVCGDNLQDRNSVGSVISKQLGYEMCGLTFPNMDEDRSFGAAGIDCTGSESHILRCQIASPQISEGQCKTYIEVGCNQGDSLYYIGTTTGNKAYHGQALLHPSSPTSRGIATASMGLVAVKEEGDTCNYWRYIEVNGHVDLTLSTTLCRQMGFTHVSEVMSKKDAETIYEMDFSLWMRWIAPTSSILTSNIHCGDISHECLGCCNYTEYLSCQNGIQYSQTAVNEDSIMVLRCSFYNDDNVLSEGGKQCAYQNEAITATCDTITFGDVRLQEGSATGGRLEYYWNSKWYTICSEGFQKEEADLVCRRLGYLYSDKFGNASSLGYPIGADEPVLFLACSDGSPANCSVSSSSCEHSFDVAVTCTNTIANEVCLQKQQLYVSSILPGAILLVLCLILAVALVIVFCRSRSKRRASYKKIDN